MPSQSASTSVASIRLGFRSRAQIATSRAIPLTWGLSPLLCATGQPCGRSWRASPNVVVDRHPSHGSKAAREQTGGVDWKPAGSFLLAAVLGLVLIRPVFAAGRPGGGEGKSAELPGKREGRCDVFCLGLFVSGVRQLLLTASRSLTARGWRGGRLWRRRSSDAWPCPTATSCARPGWGG